jgi:hypothetical protein
MAKSRHPIPTSPWQRDAMLRTALKLIEHGFAVFPCRHRSKVPATAHGFKDASRDPELIRKWWAENPLFNVAVATGEVSGVFVVDQDGADGNAELTKLEQKHGELPGTLAVCTSNGLHLYFGWPGKHVPCSVGKIAPSIDVRGDGGYCLVPPSIHPTGKGYAWSVDTASTIAVAPDWLVERAIACSGNGKGPAPVSEWREIAANGVTEGRRDDTAARFTGHLLRKYVDLSVTRELIHCWNLQRNQPPLPATDIDRIVNSIAGKESKRQGDG